MRTYFRCIVTLNFLCILGYMAGVKWLLWPLIFTALVLNVDGLTSHSESNLSALFFVGALFNFLGVVSGGITGIESVLSMAVLGSMLLLVAHWADQPTKPSATPETSGNNIPE